MTTERNLQANNAPQTSGFLAKGVLQRKCNCGNHTAGSEVCEECENKKSGLQRKLSIGASNDTLEQEADRVADEVIAMPTNSNVGRTPPHIQRLTNQPARQENTVPASVDHVLSSPGNSLEPALRQDMEQRFGHDFSQVRVHSSAAAEQSAQDVNAHAYTAGHNVVFGAGQFALGTHAGRRLLAHELTHVVQQSSLERNYLGQSKGNRGLFHITVPRARLNYLQRQQRGRTAARIRPYQQLDYRPSRILRPCACLVFIHNNERNARSAAEELHRDCHYNLAIIGTGRTRRVPIRGSSGRIDPNELFPSDIQEECARNEASCVAYEASHNDLRAMQIQFFLTIKTCSNNFTLTTVALHNNALNDTRSFLRSTRPAGRQQLRGDFFRVSDEPVTSLSELRSRLGRHRGIMDRSGTTNIFRWCNLPEISRCHIGDPDRPDFVIWVTNIEDYNVLRREDVNVVLQEGLDTTSGSESETDLSTLFIRLGAGARYINIETPISPETSVVRSSNLQFIGNVLGDLNLDCCEPVGDFPLPSSRTRRLA